MNNKCPECGNTEIDYVDHGTRGVCNLCGLEDVIAAFEIGIDPEHEPELNEQGQEIGYCGCLENSSLIVGEHCDECGQAVISVKDLPKRPETLGIDPEHDFLGGVYKEMLDKPKEASDGRSE